MCGPLLRETSGKMAANTIAQLLQKDLEVTVDPAALRNFLTLGKPNWEEVLV